MNNPYYIMKTEKNSPINRYDDKQYILDSYFENLPERCSRKVFIEDKLEKLDDNLTVWKHKDIYRISRNVFIVLNVILKT